VSYKNTQLATAPAL